MLEKELIVFENNLNEWLKTDRGKFVVIKNNDVIGIFNTYDDALVEGARRFGLTSFLLREITPTQDEISVPALTLGILHADSTQPIHRG